jgi:transcriptional regulator NrdR family protein
MKCPSCSSANTRVISTKPKENLTKRYCRCLDCQKRYITLETHQVPPKQIKIHHRQIKYGEQNNFAVLTEDNVRDIRRLAKEHTYNAIAKVYGIHKDTVYRIVNFKSWAHLKKEDTIVLQPKATYKI